MFEQPTPRLIGAHLLEQLTVTSTIQVCLPSTCQNDAYPFSIRLLGVVGKWPCGCNAASARQRLQDACGDAITEVPASRWNLALSVGAKALSVAQALYVRYGGFVVAAERFDACTFDISQAEASAMDPQQRLLLEDGYAALHTSSCRRTTLMGSDNGIYLGIERPDWSLARPPSARLSVYSTLCENVSVAAGRLCYILGLQGPCSSIDAACASGLVAVHGASLGVRGGECCGALALAVSLKLVPTVGLMAEGMLSIDGRCKTFDARANGYARSEALGALVLRADDRTAVLQLRGSSVRNDGRSASLTAPNGAAQRVLLLAALGRAAVTPKEVGRTEAHGTGTALGDPTEMGALAAVYSVAERKRVMAVAAVKGSVGHSEAPSALQGLLTLLRLLGGDGTVGNAQLRVLNVLLEERLGSSLAQFAFPTQSEAMTTLTNSCLSTFGFSGTISHAVLQRGERKSDGTRFVTLPELNYHRRTFRWIDRKAASAACMKSASRFDKAVLLLQIVQEVLPAAKQVTLDTPFAEAGFDSLSSAAFAACLQAKSGIHVNPTIILEHSTPRVLANHLISAADPQDTVERSADAGGAACSDDVPIDVGLKLAAHGTQVASTAPPRAVKPYDTASGDAVIMPALVDKYIREHSSSKAYVAAHRTQLADNRNIANFSLPFKETIHPIICRRAQGSHVIDADGHDLIDLSGGFGPILFGHNPPFVSDAVCKMLAEGAWGLGFEHELVGENSRKFCQLTGNERVTWVTTGTEATTLTMRLCRLHTGRLKIVMFQSSYHGHFDGFLGIPTTGPDKCIPQAGGIPRGFVEDLVVLPFNTHESLEWISKHSNEIAGVFCEPIQNRNPRLVARSFLSQLRTLTAARGVVLVFDEVVTGFRIGPGGAQQNLGIRADLACYGKALGGGFPVGAVGGRAEIMSGVDGGVWQFGDASAPKGLRTFFAGTMCKHPVVMAAVGAVLDHIIQHGDMLYSELNAKAARLANAVNKWWVDQGLTLSIDNYGSQFKISVPPNCTQAFFQVRHTAPARRPSAAACFLRCHASFCC